MLSCGYKYCFLPHSPPHNHELVLPRDTWLPRNDKWESSAALAIYASLSPYDHGGQSDSRSISSWEGQLARWSVCLLTLEAGRSCGESESENNVKADSCCTCS